MTSTVYFVRDNRAMKKPELLINNVFLIYAPKKLNFLNFKKIPKSANTDYDSGLTITVPDYCSAYYCSKEKEIKQFLGITSRLWFGLLNKSFSKDIVIS